MHINISTLFTLRKISKDQDKMPNPENVFSVFIGTWVILGLISFLAFFKGKNAKLKRKLWPPFVIGTATLFVIFIALMGFPLNTFFVMGPMLVLITILNLRNTKFCDSCGQTIINQNVFVKPEYCSKCGAKL